MSHVQVTNKPAANGGSSSGGEPLESEGERFLADKIIHTLTIFPIISPSMLQAALGPGCAARLWRPVLQQLIDSGAVIQKEQVATTPTGRQNSYTQLMLSPDKQKELQAVG